MSSSRMPARTPGSVGVALVVGLMFVTPVLAATTLRPLTLRFDVLFEFVRAHQLGLIVGFSLMIVIALMLKAASVHPGQRSADFETLLADASPHGLDGVA